MFLAKKIKEESEIGYILYMWQLEDVVRAYGCDSERIEWEYLPRFKYEGDTLKQEIQWWRDVVEMMRAESILEHGHLQNLLHLKAKPLGLVAYHAGNVLEHLGRLGDSRVIEHL